MSGRPEIGYTQDVGGRIKTLILLTAGRWLLEIVPAGCGGTFPTCRKRQTPDVVMSNGEIFRRRNLPLWEVGGHVKNVPPQPSGTDS